jgi:hypothetical protein
LQEELCARIPEAEKKNLRVALGLEHNEVMLLVTIGHWLRTNDEVLQEDEAQDDPGAPSTRNMLKENWDEFMGAIYSWYYGRGQPTQSTAATN